MNPIKIWRYNKTEIHQTILLFEDRLLQVRHFKKTDMEKEYSFKKLFEWKYILTSIELDYEIFKKVVELKQPDDLNNIELKEWQFWQAIDNSNLKEEIISIVNHTFWVKSKFGFAEGCGSAQDRMNRLYSWQSLSNFFFYGPYMYAVPMEDRIRIRKEIFDSLDSSKHNLTLNDSFPIFDYDKIEKIEFEKIEGIRGIYFKIIEGIVILGGWDNPRDSGENYTSIEYLWYNLKSRIPSEFHKSITYVKSVLEKGVIDV